MNVVPNQKFIYVNKVSMEEGQEYSKVDLNAKRLAAQTLSSGGFKLWNYFSDCQDKCSFFLSRTIVEEQYGIKKKQYDNAIAELIEKHFLTKKEDNRYLFSEMAQ